MHHRVAVGSAISKAPQGFPASRPWQGFDAFTSVVFHSGVDPLRDALSANGIDVTHLPAHDVPARFLSTVDELAAYDVVILSDIGANSILPHPDTWLDGKRRPNRADGPRRLGARGRRSVRCGWRVAVPPRLQPLRGQG